MRFELLEDTFLRFAGREDGTTLFFIHAFGDSGRCYESVVSQPCLQRYRLIVVDLWGFGASPRRTDVRTVGDYSSALERVIVETCRNQTVGLIGHSIAGSMAVQIGARNEELVSGVFSIEGNLTADDAMFTGRAANFDNAHAFKEKFLAEVWEMGKDSDELRHYYAGSRIADEQAMWHLGRDAKEVSAQDVLGDAFRALPVPKLYYWSPVTTPENTQRWIRQAGIPNQTYVGAGHWPMVSKPNTTAKAIDDFFQTHVR